MTDKNDRPASLIEAEMQDAFQDYVVAMREEAEIITEKAKTVEEAAEKLRAGISPKDLTDHLAMTMVNIISQRWAINRSRQAELHHKLERLVMELMISK